jgi:hypothetical protein
MIGEIVVQLSLESLSSPAQSSVPRPTLSHVIDVSDNSPSPLYPTNV